MRICQRTIITNENRIYSDFFEIEADEKEVEETLQKMQEAIDSARECIWKLERLGILRIKKDETDSGN